jgi:hypothetical protein
MQTIEPWLPPSVRGRRALNILVVTISIKLGLLFTAGVVLLVLFATGNL